MKFLITIVMIFGLAFFVFPVLADDSVDAPDPAPDGAKESGETPDKGDKEKSKPGEEKKLSPEEEFMRKFREELEKQMEAERKRIDKAEVPGKEDGESPLVKLLKDTLKNMKEAERLLAKHNPDKPCKIEIENVKKNLDTLIDFAQQQMEGEGGGQSQQQQPEKDDKSKQKQSKEKRKGPDQKQSVKPKDGRRKRNDQRSSAYQRKRKRARATLERLRRIRIEAEEMRGGEWGNLPPKIREDAMDAQADEFPEKYRDLIEEYYRRLSGEKNK